MGQLSILFLFGESFNFQNLLVVMMSIKGSIQKAARTRNASLLMHGRADFDIRVSYFGDVN